MTKPVASVPQVGRWGQGIVIASLLFIAWATLRPEPGQAATSHFCIICGDFGGEDAVLNIGLFLPFGVGLAMGGVRRASIILVGFALSASIELTQLLLIPGRDATIGDVVMNTLGTAVGALLVGSWPGWVFPSRRHARLLLVGASLGWLAIQSLASFAFRISLPQSRYYGQLARKIGNLELFTGRIDSVRVGALPIGNTIIPATLQLRSALSQGAGLVALVRPSVPTVGIAPIVRIADQNQQQILLLAQHGEAALFGVRTGASILHLRAPLFELANALPASDRGSAEVREAIQVNATYTGQSVRMTSARQVTSAVTDIRVRTSMAWMTLLPLTWLVTGASAEIVLGMIWTGSLLIPIGYYASHLLRKSTPRTTLRTMAVASALVALLVLGLLLIPLATAIGPASALDFTAGLLGLLAGSFVSYLLRLPRSVTNHEAEASP